MCIPLSDIVDSITEFSPEFHIFNKDNSSIHAVELFNKNQKLFQPDSIYVAKSSDLLKIPFKAIPMNILCITDKPFPTEYIHRLDSNIIILNKNIDTIQILNEIRCLLKVHRNYIQSSLKLMNTLLSGGSIQDILNIGHKILGNPLFLHDINFKVFGYTQGVSVDDPFWRKITNVDYFTDTEITVILEQGKIDELYKSSCPILVKTEASPHRWLVNKIVVDGNVLGNLSTIEYERQFEQSYNKLFNLISDVISSVLRRNSLFSSSKGKKYEYFIIDLLEEKKQSHEDIKQRLKYIDLNFEENLYVLTISPAQNNNEYKTHPYMLEILNSLVCGGKSLIYRNNFVIIFSCKTKILDKGYFNNISRFLEKHQLVGGLSQCFHDIADIREYYLQSVKSIDLGIRVDGRKSIYAYDDYSIYYLIDIASEHKDLKSFYNPSLITLIDYDRRNNTSYSESLYAYLSNGNSIAAAANALNIHRNTMDYRISKIEEIMNLNLSNPDITLSLYLSYKILKFAEISN
ncbi:PucR family transcriptional regulator [Clostridium magnum]|uniref:Purine catabolism regulatory protein n=1 Tax=Clostridium magnum DSM 2767 TaxID=1121326 RepID=A0A162SRZ8_9CLOT|nr:helix-turn-helix domain-containing protein [Clostridium magnum]KZL91791.1 purine catabolism regulatory protein [Clostridium magnum DSM 2767]SHI25951.1 PucR C-terminal helix-turn-helix domain-containing protein [Clostridium magnum DSM 2767]